MCEFFGSRIEKEKENNNKNHQICQTNASIVNQVLHECNLQSVKTTLKKHQIHMIDATPALTAASEKQFLHGIIDQKHFNDQGNAVLAKTILSH